MRLPFVACVLAFGIASAGPRPRLVPKPPTADYPMPALRAFLEARRTDLQGRTNGVYLDSLRMSKQANTYFNIAELALREDDVATAIENFKNYLALAPHAADHDEIEQLVAGLETGEATLVIGGTILGDNGDDTDGIVLVDGVPMPSPATVHPSPGTHWIERITAHSYEHKSVSVVAGERRYLDLSTAPDTSTGNVIITRMLHHERWSEGNVQLVAGHRFTLPKGHYVIGPGALLCKQLSFDVTSTIGTTYVQVVGDDQTNGKCFTGERLIVHTLAFGAP